MKILLTALLIATSFFASAQSKSHSQMMGEYLVKILVEETNGFIDKTTVTEENVIVTIGLPTHYDFDLVRMKVRNFTKSYYDVEVFSSWERTGGSRYTLMLLIGENDERSAVMLVYEASLNILVVGYPKDSGLLVINKL